MKTVKYIVLLVVLMVVASCNETDIIEKGRFDRDKQVQVVGRVMNFANCNVNSRGVKTGSETNIACMALAIFDSNNTCIHCEYSDKNNPVFVVERDELDNATLYIFANNPAFSAYDGETPDLQTLLDKTTQVQGIGFCKVGNVECFPMMGSYEVLPEDANDVLEIPLSALFAKIVMDIKVQPNEVIAGKEPPHFILKGYEVHNVANKVAFDGNKDIDEELYVHDEVYSAPITGNNVAQGTSNIEFSFYLPERFLTPHTAASDYNYPFKVDGKVRSEDSIYCQRFKPCLVQQVGEEGQVGYKADKKATFVRFSGEYVDHQNHNYEVTYDIYLGNDNYSNFDIERNTQYNNKITIKGVESSKDQEGSTISIDHRVGVERTQPAIISLRRETLLDSHFEVRPLRFKPTGQGSDVNINAVMVEVLDPGTTNWMRLERSFGDGTEAGSPTNGNSESIYITDNTSASYGKRRYFTYNLVDGTTPGPYDYPLNNSTSVVVPLTGDEEKCVWIYIDENTAEGDDVRSGSIKVTYGNLTSGTFTPTADPEFQAVEYVFNQRNLFNVTYDSRTYNIEYYEEYLHNFDSDEEFNNTEYEGMKWGLDGVKLSYDHPALYFKSKTGDWANDIVSYFAGEVPAYYDFYIKKHDEKKVADPKQVELHEYAGFDFSKEIIQVLNGDDGKDINISYDIDILSLDETPRSAVEYCLNKNKRNSEGLVFWKTGDKDSNGKDIYNQDNLKWYLPSIDEMEDIMMSKYHNNTSNTYAHFIEFQDKFYWSSQPSYIQNYAHLQWTLIFFPLDYWGTFYYEDIGDTSFDINNETDRKNVGSARSTKVIYSNGYTTSPSGTDGYYSYYDAGEKKYSYSGTFNNVSIGNIQRDDGNKPRNAMARVRCVRKQ